MVQGELLRPEQEQRGLHGLLDLRRTKVQEVQALHQGRSQVREERLSIILLDRIRHIDRHLQEQEVTSLTEVLQALNLLEDHHLQEVQALAEVEEEDNSSSQKILKTYFEKVDDF